MISRSKHPSDTFVKISIASSEKVTDHIAYIAHNLQMIHWRKVLGGCFCVMQ